MPDLPHTRAPQQPLPRTAKETPMNPYLIDAVLVAGLMLGYIAVGVAGAVVLTRIGLGIRDFLNRNDR